jgi:hypothetical protein
VTGGWRELHNEVRGGDQNKSEMGLTCSMNGRHEKLMKPSYLGNPKIR